MRLMVVGISFRTAPIEIRERIALGEAGARQLLRYLVGHGGFAGAAALSTCNRTELYLSVPDEASAAEVASRVLSVLDPEGGPAIANHATVSEGEGGVLHLFRVAAGLDSMIVGEGQVLHQVRAAHRLALEAGSLDASLDFVFRRAIGAGRRVRAQTAIGTGAGSLSEAAVALAAAVLGSLEGRSVLLLGAGKMSSLAARQLSRRGAELRIASRGGSSAASLAAQLGAQVVAAGDLGSALVPCDLIIASTSSSRRVLDLAALLAAQQRRGGRPLCVVDLAVPRDVDPAVAGLPGVTLLDIDDLGRWLQGNLAGRRDAVLRAEAMAAEEAGHAVRIVGQRDTAHPTIRALVARAEEIRRREVARTVAQLPDRDPATVERIERLSRSLIRKLLHAPIAHLREAGGDAGAALRLREAFGLDDAPAGGS